MHWPRAIEAAPIRKRLGYSPVRLVRSSLSIYLVFVNDKDSQADGFDFMKDMSGENNCLFLPNVRMGEHISIVWLGSNPLVGSSRIRISGSCRMVRAKPKRYRNHLDTVSVDRERTESNEKLDNTGLMRFLL